MSRRQISEVLEGVGQLRQETEKKFDLLFDEFRTTRFPEENSNSPLQRRMIAVDKLNQEIAQWKWLAEKISLSMENPISRIPAADSVVIRIRRNELRARNRSLIQRHLKASKKQKGGRV